jgi:hypothetical protein
MALASLAWGSAYARGVTQTLHLTLVFIFGHFLLLSLVTATLFFFLVGRLLGPGNSLLPGRRRGLYNLNDADAGKEELEFGYCWDVAIRAFVPVWVFLYIIQFLCMPLIGTDHWYVNSPPIPSPFSLLLTHITQALPPPLKHTLPLRLKLLLHHHLPGLQRAAVPAPHGAAARADSRHDDIVVLELVWV